MYLLYSLLLSLGLGAMLPLFWLRNAPDGRYTRFLGERLGGLAPLAAPGAIWVHAVSVGEALAVERLIAQLQLRFPDRPVVLSVTTAAGRALAERRIGAARIFYFPLDFRMAARRSLRALHPALVLITETEIWPNFLRAAAQDGIPVMFLNGRISGRSFARYQMIRRLLRPVLQPVRAFLMQTATDAERVLALGAAPERVQVAGNLKFDLVPPERPGFVRWLAAELARAGIGEVVVAGSTMEGEEPLLLEAWQHLSRHDRLLVLAPRHPQRFAAVAALLAASGLGWSRRSQWKGEAEAQLPPGGVLLLDSLGELASAFELATVAYVGGSLTPNGGDNLLEPAYWGVPLTFGPHMQNFAAIAEQFLAAGAAHEASSSFELERVWQRLLEDPEERRRTGAAARALLASPRGPPERALDAIAAVLQAVPNSG